MLCRSIIYIILLMSHHHNHHHSGDQQQQVVDITAAHIITALKPVVLPDRITSLIYDYTATDEIDQVIATYATEIGAAAKFIHDADAVLICAAAGMSIGCGLNYTSEEDFKRQYPAYIQHGYTTGYSTMGMARSPEALRWGFLSQHVYNMRYRDTPHQGYVDLKALVGNKSYWVHTSNVDGLFPRAGFDPAHTYTPQGDFGTRSFTLTRVWESDIVARMLS
jgi:hypothetical protein